MCSGLVVCSRIRLGSRMCSGMCSCIVAGEVVCEVVSWQLRLRRATCRVRSCMCDMCVFVCVVHVGCLCCTRSCVVVVSVVV